MISSLPAAVLVGLLSASVHAAESSSCSFYNVPPFCRAETVYERVCANGRGCTPPPPANGAPFADKGDTCFERPVVGSCAALIAKKQADDAAAKRGYYSDENAALRAKIKLNSAFLEKIHWRNPYFPQYDSVSGVTIFPDTTKARPELAMWSLDGALYGEKIANKKLLDNIGAHPTLLSAGPAAQSGARSADVKASQPAGAKKFAVGPGPSDEHPEPLPRVKSPEEEAAQDDEAAP
jgi:hypothetical protein